MWPPDPRPDEGLLHAWLDGALAPEQAARVERLVRDDPAWAAAAAQARGLIANASRLVRALDDAPVAGARPPARRPARVGVRWGSCLAGMAAALLVALLGREAWRQQAPQVGIAPAQGPAPTTSKRSAPPAPRFSGATRSAAPAATSPVAPSPRPAAAPAIRPAVSSSGAGVGESSLKRSSNALAADSAATSARASWPKASSTDGLVAPAQPEAFRVQAADTANTANAVRSASRRASAAPAWADSTGCARVSVVWESGETARYEGATTASPRGNDAALVTMRLPEGNLRATVGGPAGSGRALLLSRGGSVLRQGVVLGIEPCSAPAPPRD